MFKHLVFLCLLVFAFSFVSQAQQLRKLPLPDDISTTNLIKAAATAEAINKDIDKKEKTMFNNLQNTPTVSKPPVSKNQVSSQRQTNKNQVYRRNQVQNTNIITPTSIDEKLSTCNNLSSTVFYALRKQYNYILKLESELKRMSAIWAQDKKNWTKANKTLQMNIAKLKQQNNSYLRIFEKFKVDTHNLKIKINNLQKATQQRDSRINHLENIIKSLQERLVKIKALSTLGRQ